MLPGEGPFGVATEDTRTRVRVKLPPGTAPTKAVRTSHRAVTDGFDTGPGGPSRNARRPRTYRAARARTPAGFAEAPTGPASGVGCTPASPARSPRPGARPGARPPPRARRPDRRVPPTARAPAWAWGTLRPRSGRSRAGRSRRRPSK